MTFTESAGTPIRSPGSRHRGTVEREGMRVAQTTLRNSEDTQSKRSSMNYNALLKDPEDDEQLQMQLAMLKRIIDDTIDIHEMFN